MVNQTNKKILIYILIFSSLVLFSAFIIEYGLGHKPCKLCVYERIPYFLSMLLIILIFLLRSYEKIIILILSLVFFVSFVLAFYHLGIEQGFFEESWTCATKDLVNTLSKDELLKQLEQNTISCKDVSFKILGLSLAAFNTIFSIILSVIFIRLFINNGKN